MLPGLSGVEVASQSRKAGVCTPILMLTAKGELDDKVLGLDAKSLTLHCITTGQSVHLSEKECRVLEYLLSNQKQIISKEQLAVKIWGYENEAEYNKVEVYISFTRKKLAFVGSRVEIKAIRSAGYELRWECA